MISSTTYNDSTDSSTGTTGGYWFDEECDEYTTYSTGTFYVCEPEVIEDLLIPNTNEDYPDVEIQFPREEAPRCCLSVSGFV